MRGGLGLADHNKDFYFYSEWIEKLLESFRQRYGIIQFMFLKYKAICHKHYVILADEEVIEEVGLQVDP